MRIPDLFQTAIKGVTVNITRSLLTMLGIIIGVGAVVLMSSVGASMQGVILGQISSLGSRSMVVFPGTQEGGAGQVQAGFDSLTLDDVDAMKKLSTIETVAPVIFLPGVVSYGTQDASPQVFGITPDFFLNQSINIAEGRLLEQADEDGSRDVAVVAPDTATKLFGQASPVGKRIRIGTIFVTVIGVTKPLGSQFFQSADDRVYVPFSKAKDVTGQKYVNYVTMQATTSFDVAIDEVTGLLRQRHDIKNPKNDPKKDDFVIHSSEQASQILGGVSLGLTFFITTIAAISLLVGGIGIMNIMLVSVTERTREIGLRKAVGATRRDILLQFLVEAVLLTGIGGVIGLIGGVGLAFVIALVVKGFLSTYLFAVSVPSMIVSLLMAAFTGLVFGLSPARAAAALQPMEALRYE